MSLETNFNILPVGSCLLGCLKNEIPIILDFLVWGIEND